MDKIKALLQEAPIKQLEAIYNNCWRNDYNEIDQYKNRLMMDLIERECLRRFVEITGRGGSWELKPLFKQGYLPNFEI